MRAQELPLRETLAFLTRVLPAAPLRVLEVGAGDGDVAIALAGRGYDVAAIDPALGRPDAADAARVRWIDADFLYHSENDRYDVVLFTRSLHHLESLETALERAAGVLRPGGVVLAEEFAFDRVNLPTARWFYDLQSVLGAGGLLDAFEAGGEEGNPLGRWRREHTQDGPLHSGHAMLAAARERFELTLVEEAPYLYRYISERVREGVAGDRVAAHILELERRLLRERDLAAAGLRFVGKVTG